MSEILFETNRQPSKILKSRFASEELEDRLILSSFAGFVGCMWLQGFISHSSYHRLQGYIAKKSERILENECKRF